jgi:hypothetical protein
MKRRVEAVLIAMIAVQLVHAVEEFVFEFWSVFPPMRAVYGGVPDLGIGVFVSFHIILILFGVWCYMQLRRGGLKAREAVLAWVVIQGVTLAVHIAWFIVDPRYQPGLATAPLFLATIAAAIAVSKREGITERGSGT